MLTFVVRRLAALVPVLFVVAVFVFSLIHITPGDPAAYMLGPSASPAEVEHLRGVLGLNLPLYQQFGIWLGRALRGDLGQSIFMGIPVSVSIAQRLEPTFLLTLLAVIFMVAIGIPAGTLAATATAGRAGRSPTSTARYASCGGRWGSPPAAPRRAGARRAETPWPTRWSWPSPSSASRCRASGLGST